MKPSLRTTLFLTFLFLLCGLSVVHAQAGPAPAPASQSEALRNAAKALAAKYDYDGANQLLTQAYALDKTSHLQDAATDLTMIGENEIRMGQDTRALDYLQQALPLRRQVGDRKGEAQTLSRLADVCGAMSRYDTALGYLQQVLPILRKLKDRQGEAVTLANLGTAYEHMSQYDSAIDFYQQVLPILREVKDQAGEANMLGNLGVSYDSLSQYERAIDYYQQALLIQREVKNREGEAVTLNYLGRAYEHLSQYERAIVYLQMALPIRRQVGDRAGEAVTLSNLGATYGSLSQYERAISYYQQALPIRREVGDRAGEAHTLGNLGAAYDSLNQYAKAIDYYQQALLIQREVKNREGEAVTLNYLGRAYEHLSQYDRAIDYFQQALPIQREVKNRQGEAGTLNNLGVTCEHLSQYKRALDYHQLALPIRREVGDRAGEAVTLSNLGAVCDDLSQYAKAIDYYQQALPIQQEVKDRQGEAVTLSNLGSAYDSLSQYEMAVSFYQQALLIHREVKDRAGEAVTLSNLMTSWQDQHQPRLAIFYGKQAVNVFQSIRQSINMLDKESRTTYLASVSDTYRRLAELLIAQGRLPEAQQVLKLLKEQEFYDFLGRGPQQTTLTLGTADLTAREHLWAQRDRLAADTLASLGQEIQTLQGKKVPTAQDQARLAVLQGKLAATSAAQTLVQAQIVRDFTGATSAADAPPRTLSAQSPGHVLPPGTTAVYTIVAPDKLYLIVTTPTGQVARQSAVKSDDLYRKVLALRNALQDPTRDPRPLAHDLYQLIVGPIEADLLKAHATTILWSLDDALRYLPMPALYDGKHYLVERYDNALLTLAAPTQTASSVNTPWTGLGLGVSEAHPGFDALPGVRAELSGIFGPVVPGISLMDANFTQTSFLAGLKHRNHPLVHIASHFALSGRDTDSFLLLGDGGHLTLADLKADPNVFQGVDLLALSACNTAMEVRSAGGKEVEGFGALAQRLGARSVLASLWPVADASTPVLMREFYRLRRANPKLSKASGLRQAQMELLTGKVSASSAPSKTNRAQRAKIAGAANTSLPLFAADPKAPYAHPYYWAPFVLIGNPR